MNKCKRCGEDRNKGKYLCDDCIDNWSENIDYRTERMICMCCYKKVATILCDECKKRETPYLKNIKPNLLKDKPYEIKTLIKEETQQKPKTRFSMLELD